MKIIFAVLALLLMQPLVAAHVSEIPHEEPVILLVTESVIIGTMFGPEYPALLRISNKESVGISEVEFSVKQPAENVRFVISRYSANPTGSAPSGSVYAYLEMTPENVQADNLAHSKVRFEVPKQWLIENNVAPTQIRLYHFGESWKQAPTVVRGETDVAVEFEAQPTSFSPFAIAAAPDYSLLLILTVLAGGIFLWFTTKHKPRRKKN